MEVDVNERAQTEHPLTARAETPQRSAKRTSRSRRGRPRWRPAFALAFALLLPAMMIAGSLTPVLAAPLMAVDDQGADDEPGQKDLNFLTVDYAPGPANTIAVTWGWDDTSTSGNNTRDACTLFDTDGDGFANYSFCVIVATNGTSTTALQ
jgi:hypothetical protein